MKFEYKARNKDGQIKSGSVVASSASQAETLLVENGLIIVELNQQEESLIEHLDLFGGRVSNKDLVLFSRQLATLIAARVPIIQALRILQSQVENKKLISVLKDVVASVENGESFSLALSKHPKIFGNVYVSLVKSGEVSGALNQSLTYLADQLEKDYELRSKVKGAMTYPTFVLATLGLVGILMFKFVLPNLTEILKQQGANLPTISVWLIAATDFFKVYWWLVISVVVFIIVGIRIYIFTEPGRKQWDLLKINIPFIKTVFIQIYLARFSRNLSTLVSGGLPIIQALKIVADVINNVVYREIITNAATELQNGKSISDSISGYREFPAIVVQMVRVGEQTAQLDDILLKLAVFYEKEVEAKVSTLTTLLEPLIMIILGVAVGGLVAGVLLPIYNLASQAG